ncbi:MAG: hypothetical protein M3238_07260 [Actinomycetota bacterium]|nr:hypothetical protein [Actinomycetota bacterium]
MVDSQVVSASPGGWPVAGGLVVVRPGSGGSGGKVGSPPPVLVGVGVGLEPLVRHLCAAALIGAPPKFRTATAEATIANASMKPTLLHRLCDTYDLLIVGIV